jgi:excisionase family DNA binding protein
MTKTKTDQKPMTTGLLTIREVCALCGVSISTGRRWVARGLLQAVVLPDANLRFRPEDVDQFVEAHRGASGAPCPG